MTERRYLVTAGLPYSNGRLHVGHMAGAYLPADIYVRYRRARGDEVRFICGSDDNGVAALQAARNEGRPVAELTADYNARQQQDFNGLGIAFDVYGGTHQPAYYERHRRVSQAFFRTLLANGAFVKRRAVQLYDATARQFLPDRFVKGTCYHRLANFVLGLVRDGLPERARTAFRWEDFIRRNNDELLAALGNFVHRTLTFAHRYCDGRVPEAGDGGAEEHDQRAAVPGAVDRVTECLETFRFKAALAEVMTLARAGNRYFDGRQPWRQRTDDVSGCRTTIHTCLQTIRTLATLSGPFLPFSAERCAAMLGLTESPLPWAHATAPLPAGQRLGEPQVLFEKLDEGGF